MKPSKQRLCRMTHVLRMTANSTDSRQNGYSVKNEANE
jgi:hypothetical protein